MHHIELLDDLVVFHLIIPLVLTGIDLDQAAIVSQLRDHSAAPNYTIAKSIYENGAYSTPSAECTFDSSSLELLPAEISKSDRVFFLTVSGSWMEGKAYKSYTSSELSTISSKFVFAYPVANEEIQYEYGTGPVDPGDACWVGNLPAALRTTAGCISGSTSHAVSTIVIGTGTGGVSGCTTGPSGGFGTCSHITARLTATCTNIGGTGERKEMVAIGILVAQMLK